MCVCVQCGSEVSPLSFLSVGGFGGSGGEEPGPGVDGSTEREKRAAGCCCAPQWATPSGVCCASGCASSALSGGGFRPIPRANEQRHERDTSFPRVRGPSPTHANHRCRPGREEGGFSRCVQCRKKEEIDVVL